MGCSRAPDLPVVAAIWSIVVAAGLVAVSGPAAAAATPPPGADDPDHGWMETFNFYRANAGLDPVGHEPHWRRSLGQASAYMVVNDVLTHDLDPSKPAYTDAADEAASAANLFASPSADTPAMRWIDGWMTSPRHGLAMMRPDLERTAFASHRDPASDQLRAAGSLDVLRGLDRDDDGDGYPLTFPGDDTTVPLVATTNPDHAGCGDRNPQGVPLRLILDPDGDPRIDDSEVRVNGTPVDHCAVDHSDYQPAPDDDGNAWAGQLERDGMVLLTPDEPFAVGDHVAVTVDTAVDGTVDWTFEVQPGATIDAHPEPAAWPDDARLDVVPDGDGTVTVAWEPAATAAGYGIRRYDIVVGDDPRPVDTADPHAAQRHQVVAPADAEIGVRVHRAHGLPVDHPDRIDLTDPPGIDRAAGRDRVETAAAVARQAFADAADTVLLARADDFADALAAAPLAAASDAPLLLTHTDRLPAATAAEIDRLAPQTVTALGGDHAISAGVVDAAVDAAGSDTVNTVRLWGSDRFATAAAIADELRHTTGRAAGDTPVYVADGLAGWPDAVAVSAVAAHQQAPLLLAAGDTLPDDSRRAADGADGAVVVGGEQVVGDPVIAALTRAAGTVDRLAGAHRYATARHIRRHADAVGMDADEAWVATGRDWPDSLVAGGPAGARGAPLQLVDGRDHDDEPSTVVDDLARRAPARIVIVGGDHAITTPLAFVLSHTVDR